MGTILVWFAAALALPAAGDERPNFIVFFADDLGAAELACYGHREHKTPNLDRLAASGVKFETAYACPICHPSRFMLLTGQYGSRNGVYNFPGRRGGPAVADQGPDDIASHLTLGKFLNSHGYATAMAGKWQLSGSIPGLIHECGFDEYCCWAYRAYYERADLERAKAAGINFRSRYWKPSVIRNGRWVPTKDADYGEDLFADFVIDFVRRNKDEPFFVYYPMCLTHSPWLPTPDSVRPGDEKNRSSRANFAANVAYLDKVVGRVVRAVEEAGLAERTVMFFTADNGTGFRGKAEATELGARVPMIVHGPGRIQQRGATGELTDLSDLFPTISELAGLSLPTDRAFDGKSLAPFLTGKSESTREWIFAYIGDRRILRTKRWLLEDNSPLHYGRLVDCGDSRDGRDYREVTSSTSSEVAAAKAMFDGFLRDLPAPVLAEEGRPNERVRGRKAP